jgi:hemolysin activation/secretion protein|tara:strand:- start:509 stop:781 length:273 start_codon:yes stop_codon:yes gene_type:complete
MQYGLIDYSLALNGYGTRLGASYGALNYALGDEIAALKAHGQAQTGGLWERHSFIRAAKYNLYGTVKYNYADLEDRVDVVILKMTVMLKH